MNITLHIRVTAKLAKNTVIPGDASLHQLPYQSVVPFDKETMTEIIESYMLLSEQLDSRLWLEANDSVTRGFLLQKLPREKKSGKDGLSRASEDTTNTWDNLVALSSTIEQDEMCKVSYFLEKAYIYYI